MMAPAEGRFTLDAGKTTQFSDAWVILALLLTLFGLIFRLPVLLAGAAAMLVVAAVCWAWNRVALDDVTYARLLSESRAFPGEEVTLTLEVQNRKRLPLTWLVVRDAFPAGLPIDDRDLSVNHASNQAEFMTLWMPGGRQTIRRRFRVRCAERGLYRFGPASAESGDPFGFFEQKKILETQDRLIVYPRLYSVAELGLPARNPFGEQRATLPLYEDALRPAGVREWRSSDSMRRIHWKASARSQELQSRLYEPSEEFQVELVLNVATMERHWLGVYTELHERAVSVAASLAALAVELRYPTGLMANGIAPGSDREIRLLPGRSPRQLMLMLEQLAAVTHFATQPVEDLLRSLAPRLPWGTTIVLVTAIAHADLLATLRELADAGRRIVLVTLAARPPSEFLHPIVVYHLPHLVEDLIVLHQVGV